MKVIASQKVDLKGIKGASKQVTTIYLTNKVSATLIIPIEMARRNGLDQPQYVTVEETGNGVLIKKLEID